MTDQIKPASDEDIENITILLKQPPLVRMLILRIDELKAQLAAQAKEIERLNSSCAEWYEQSRRGR